MSARGTPYSCGSWQTFYNATAVAGLLRVQASEGPGGGALPRTSWLSKAVLKGREQAGRKGEVGP